MYWAERRRSLFGWGEDDPDRTTACFGLNKLFQESRRPAKRAREKEHKIDRSSWKRERRSSVLTLAGGNEQKTRRLILSGSLASGKVKPAKDRT